MTDKMREEFETAVALESKEPVLAVYLSRRGDTYSTSTLHFAWWAWKASRAALVVELPDADGLNREHMLVQGFLEGVAHTRVAIEAAGLKVKP